MSPRRLKGANRCALPRRDSGSIATGRTLGTRRAPDSTIASPALTPSICFSTSLLKLLFLNASNPECPRRARRSLSMPARRSEAASRSWLTRSSASFSQASTARCASRV